jgi:uncharacterized RDD family membrane protein YckC
MQWYYAIDDQRLGPVSHMEFERLVQSGKIQGGALVWRKGMDQWKTLDEVKERDPALFADAPPPLPPAEIQADDTEAYTGAQLRRAPRLESDDEKPKAPGGLLYAGFWRRLCAHLVDLLAWWMIWMIISEFIVRAFFPEMIKISESVNDIIAKAGPFAYKPSPEEAAMVMRYSMSIFAGAVISAILYDALFILRFGATPGKLLFGLRVVNVSGKPLGLRHVVARCLAKGLVGLPTLCIGYLIVAFDEEKRGLHDQIAQTRVIIKRSDL